MIQRPKAIHVYGYKSVEEPVCTYVVGMQQSQDVIFCGGPIQPLKAEVLVCKQGWLWGASRSVQS